MSTSNAFKKKLPVAISIFILIHLTNLIFHILRSDFVSSLLPDWHAATLTPGEVTYLTALILIVLSGTFLLIFKFIDKLFRDLLLTYKR